jgi:3',5'-cyclic AMP phosphodiesterase CpdA
MPPSPSRRDLLKLGALAAGAAAIGLPIAPALGATAPPPRASRKRSLGLAHLTDIHIQPERKAAEGLAACLHHVQSLSGADRPELILTGGDLVFDSLAVDEARARLQWELYRKVFKDDCSLPVEHCIGNHDVWGWNRTKSRTTGDEPMWGKKFALDQLGLAASYRTFDRAGWRFILLDSVFPDPNDPDGYIGRLDDAQFAWLERTLAETPAATPILILSHIPILSATIALGDPDAKTLKREISPALLHTDSTALRTLFAKHPNIKACLSGHTHRIDRVDFRGITYLCNGAVSGNWWKGQHYECAEGYAVIDLFDDGTLDSRYIPYGWTASP